MLMPFHCATNTLSHSHCHLVDVVDGQGPELFDEKVLSAQLL